MSTELTQDLEHVDEGMLLLIEQFKNSTNLKSFISVFLNRVQEIENALYDLWISRYLDTAVGAQLDGLGQIVGVDRGNSDDDRYRIQIRARILLNITSGTPDEILAIVRLLLPTGAANPIFLEFFPASFLVDAVGSGPLTTTQAEEIGIAVNKSTPAGVQGDFLYSLYAATDTFTLSSQINTADTSTTLGLANDAETTGGHLAGVY